MSDALDIKPSWRGNAADSAQDASGKNGQRSDRLNYTVVPLDPSLYDANKVLAKLAASYGFRCGNLHPYDNGLTLRSVRVNRLGPAFYSLETSSQSAASAGGGGATPGSSPLDDIPEVETSFAGSEAELDQDINGNPIVTKNGEPLLGVQDEINELVITVSRNLPAWDYLLANQYMGSGKTPPATNADTFLGFAPGAARLKGLSAKSVASDGFLYFRATAIVQFRAAAPGSTVAKAWWQRIRHEGYIVRDAAGDARAKWHHAYDGAETKNLVTSPVQLKLDGTQETDPALAHWLEFQTSPSLDYAALGFF